MNDSYPFTATGRPPAAVSRTLAHIRIPAAIAVALFLIVPLPGRAGLPPVFDRQQTEQPVAEGVTLISERRFDADGWLNLFTLEIDRASPGISLDTLLSNERLTKPAPLAESTRRRNAVASVNGDFFHIGTLGTPLSWHLQSGRILKSAPDNRRLAFAVPENPEASPFIGELAFDGRVETGRGARRSLAGWNKHQLGNNVLIAYDRHWGSHAPGPDSAHLDSESGPFFYAVLGRDHRVRDLLERDSGPPIPEDGLVLLGRGDGAAWLREHARLDAALEVSPGVQSPLEQIFAAIGGNPVLVSEGEVNTGLGGPAHPRTAVGFSEDGKTVWLVLVDGRSHLSRGVTLPALAEFMRDLGAHDALNLDGGGSSTLLARTPGHSLAALANRPSDGRERAVPNGLGVFSEPGNGEPGNLFLEHPSPPGEYLVASTELRLAVDSEARIEISATDSRHHPAEISTGDIEWSVQPRSLGHVDDSGVLVASTPGLGRVTASLKDRPGTSSRPLPVRVIGEAVALETEPAALFLHQGGSAWIQVNAIDANGFRAPLPTESLDWESTNGIGSLEDGRFEAADETTAGVVRIRRNDLEIAIPVGVGGESRSLDLFEDTSSWSVHSVPGPTEASIARKDAGVADGSSALRLTYNFAKSGGTRAAYVRPDPADRELPGNPLKIGLDVYGDGNGAWLRGHIVDGRGNRHTIDFARNVDWSGWRTVEATLPEDINAPVSLSSLYLVEPNAENRYAGEIAFNRLTVVAPPKPDAGLVFTEPARRDPANRPAPAGHVADGRIRFAVLGGGNADRAFAGNEDLLEHAIDRINREPVSFTVHTGKAGEARPPEAAKTLFEELEHPYYVVPGPGETENIEAFRNTFGSPHRAFSQGNARFLMLNTGLPGLRASDPQQWPWLTEQLAGLEENIVILLTHASLAGWSDRSEAELLQNRLTRLHDEGKTVYVIGSGQSGFHREAYDGIHHLVTGGITAPPGNHNTAFPHYLVVTVTEPSPDNHHGENLGSGGLTYEVVPLLQGIEMEASEIRLTTGETFRVRANGTSYGTGISFPLEYPARAEWRVEDPEIGEIDSRNGTFTARAAGATRVAVIAGGANAVARIIVED